jgi:HEAT repeat protein
MPTLSSSIVKHQVATMREVEEALARQVLYGGDLATNLLELAAVGEAELTGLLAESHGLEPAPTGELPRAGDTTLKLVPGDLALRHGLYPLTERDGELIVAVSEPLAEEVEQDLGFALGVTIAQRAAPLVRIRQAIARDYGLALDRRTLRLIAKLEGRPDPSPSSMPSPRRGFTEMQALPRPPSIPPIQYGLPSEPPAPPDAPPPSPPPERVDSERPAPRAESSAPPPSTAEPAGPESRRAPPDLARWARAATRAGRRKTRHRGPYTAAMAEADFLDAETRDDVLRALFDFAAQYFEYAALFAVHSDIAEGRDARGPGADRARITGIGVPLDLPGALATARDAGTWQLIALASEGIDAGLAGDLERRTGKVVLLLPIVVRGRCVLILYGDHGGANVELGDVGEVIAFAPLVSAALERVIVRQKLAARQAVAQETGLSPGALGVASLRPAAVRGRAPAPSPEERARVLAEALNASAAAPITTRATPSAQKRAPTIPGSPAPPPPGAARASSPVRATRVVPVGSEPRHPTPHGPEFVRPVLSIGGEARVSTPPHGTPHVIESDRPPDATPVFSLTRRSTPATALDGEPPEDGWESASTPSPFPTREAGTKPGVGSFPPRSSPRITPAPLSQRVPGSSPHLELVSDDANARGPEISVGEAELDDDIDDELLEREGEVPLAPPSRTSAHAPHRLRPRFSSKELRLPSVIVDTERDCQELVSRLVKGDADAGKQLAEMGEPAVSALVSKFPGPISAEPRRSGESPTRASECGPILQTLARLGHVAVPFLVVRTADASPDVRAWATRLLGEMPGVDSAQAVVRRLVDPDPDVHHSALAAARMLMSDADSRTALREGLTEIALDGAAPDDARHAAIEAITDLRDARAVPRLIQLVSAPNADIVKSAEWSLGVLTRQSFGHDATRWAAWWKEHSAAHRIEWLIDALMHEDSDVRRAAGEELKSITKEYFGYYEDLPRKERGRAQKRYREWWESKGKARFPQR